MAVLPDHYISREAKRKPQLANFPATYVCWNDAVKFCNRLSEIEGLDRCYVLRNGQWELNHDAVGYRLPSEAEWEFAYRCGTSSLYPFDQALVGENCWYEKNSDDHANEVAQKRPNAFGLYDMGGNVWEWCSDRFSNSTYQHYVGKVAVDPFGMTHGRYNKRALKSSDWSHPKELLRSSKRCAWAPDDRRLDQGLRVLLVLPHESED